MERYFDKKDEIKFLFEKIQNKGDQEALKKLFLIYFPRLNDYARKIINNDTISQDIVQDVFVKLWKIRKKLENANIESYLFRMVKNKCLDYIKHIKVISNLKTNYSSSVIYEELYRIDFVGDEPYFLIEKELEAEIEKLVLSLPERCKEVFILSRVNGLKNREIAEKLNISIKNVERHITKALNIFKTYFSNSIPLALIVLVARNLNF